MASSLLTRMQHSQVTRKARCRTQDEGRRVVHDLILTGNLTRATRKGLILHWLSFVCCKEYLRIPSLPLSQGYSNVYVKCANICRMTEKNSTHSKNYITPEGYAALEAEFQHLRTVERPEVVRTVAWAASNGDRSENGDYIYGKKRLRQIDSRMRFLMKRLDNAEIVDP